MWNWQNELAFVKAAIEEFEHFLFSDEIYWQISFNKKDHLPMNFQPRLSAGRLDVAIFILSFYSKKDPKIHLIVSDPLEQIHLLQENWKSNWIKKSTREFSVRSRQWELFLHELRGKNVSQAEYNNQVEVRLFLDLLSIDISKEQNSPAFISLVSFDSLLKLSTKVGIFVWEDSIEAAFPVDRFWYLYRSVA